MNLTQYLHPVDFNKSDFISIPYFDSLFCNMYKFSDTDKLFDIENYDIALIGIPEDRNTPNKGTAKAPDLIRKSLYELYKPVNKIKIIDLGNLKKGNKINDTYAALSDIIHYLNTKNITTILIGGSSEFISPVFSAYKKSKKDITLCDIDARFDFGTGETFNSESYLHRIQEESVGVDFRFINIGYQTYYCPEEELSYLTNETYELHRLGIVRQNIELTEPQIRDADIVSIDISSGKSSDAPGHYNPSIHGFYGEELCQIARYAGMSDKLTFFGIFEVNPDFDINNRTSKLSAQIIWHFIQGFYQRKNEYPVKENAEFKKYMVHIPDIEGEIIFYKSNKTERWWFEVPQEKEEPKIYSCSHEDFLNASKEEIPEKWWKLYKQNM